MRKRSINLIYSAFLIVAYSLHTIPSVYSSELKVGIKPVGSKSINLEDILNPGENKEVLYRLVNLSEDDLNVKLELAGISGSYEGQAQYDISQKYKILDYVKLQVDQIVLKKSEKRDINLSLSVPEGSDPGEYLGGLLVKDADTGEVLGESKVNLLVNGNLERRLDANFSIDVQNDVPVAHIKLTNLGNTKIEGIKVEYTIKNLKFKDFISSERTDLYTSPIIILPGDVKEIEYPLDVTLDPIGTYETTAVISYGGLQPLTFKEGFNHTSKKKMAIFGTVMSVVFVIFVLGIFYFSRWFFRKRSQVKAVNKKWDAVVSNLIEGNAVGALNPGTIKLHDDDVTVLVNAMRKELRKTIRDEIRTLNPTPVEYYESNSEKSKKARIKPVNRTSSITSLL